MVMLPFSKEALPAAFQDERVLKAMESIPRQLFVPLSFQEQADEDVALPIGHGQTISQPFLVAFMTGALNLPENGGRVLEIGTGSGYQTAVLSKMGAEVFSIEVVPELASNAKRTLGDLNLLTNVHLKVGDGRFGWPSEAPFDGIICAAASRYVQPSFIEQVAVGGRLVLPVGPKRDQILKVLEKRSDQLVELGSAHVRFVPLIAPKTQA